MPLRQLNPIVLDSVFTFVGTKEPTRVIKQTPAPGTPVPEGMTIEVHAVSYSDIPFSVLDPSAPDFIKNVSAANVEKIINDSAVFKTELAKGSTADATVLRDSFNTSAQKFGVSQIPTTTTINHLQLVNSLKFVGFTQ